MYTAPSTNSNSAIAKNKLTKLVKAERYIFSLLSSSYLSSLSYKNSGWKQHNCDNTELLLLHFGEGWKKVTEKFTELEREALGAEKGNCL